jgi:hypothetical protein
MGQTRHDTPHNRSDHKKKQGDAGPLGKKILQEDQQELTGRPDKGGTAGQSGGEQAKNRSSNPASVKP